MMTAQREPSRVPAPAVDSRSPFVRLTELIAGIEPGKPAINLSVGEPQHPIPSFVGPVLAAHLNDFGRYPANKGIEPFRHAVAAWLGRRYKLPRAGRSRKRSAGAQRHARGPVPRARSPPRAGSRRAPASPRS